MLRRIFACNYRKEMCSLLFALKYWYPMLRLQGSALQTGSFVKSQLKIPRQDGSQSACQFIRTEISGRDDLILMKPGSIAAGRFYNVPGSLTAGLLGNTRRQVSRQVLQPVERRNNKYRRLQRSQDVQLLCSSAERSLQNRSLSIPAPQSTEKCHRMGFLGSCFIIRARLLIKWWTVRRVDISNPAIPHSGCQLSQGSYILFIWPTGNIWHLKSLTALTSSAGNFLSARALPAFRVLCSGAGCPANIFWGYRLIPKMTIPSSFRENWSVQMYY